MVITVCLWPYAPADCHAHMAVASTQLVLNMLDLETFLLLALHVLYHINGQIFVWVCGAQKLCIVSVAKHCVQAELHMRSFEQHL